MLPSLIVLITSLLGQVDIMQEPFYGGAGLVIYKSQGFHNDKQALMSEITRYSGTDLRITFVRNNGEAFTLHPRFNDPFIIHYPSSESYTSYQFISEINTAIKRFPQLSQKLNGIKKLKLGVKNEPKENAEEIATPQNEGESYYEKIKKQQQTPEFINLHKKLIEEEQKLIEEKKAIAEKQRIIEEQNAAAYWKRQDEERKAAAEKQQKFEEKRAIEETTRKNEEREAERVKQQRIEEQKRIEEFERQERFSKEKHLEEVVKKTEFATRHSLHKTLFICYIFFALIAATIGSLRGRPMIGLVFGFILGPIGCLISCFVRNRAKEKENELKQKMIVRQNPIEDIDKTFRIKKNGKDIGNIQIRHIPIMLETRQISLSDKYYDTENQVWAPIELNPFMGMFWNAHYISKT